MKRIRTRILSGILMLAMLIGLLPVLRVSAAGTELVNETFSAALDSAKWNVDGTAGAISGGSYQLYGGTDLRYADKLTGDFAVDYDVTLNDCDGWTALRFAKPAVNSTHDTGADMLFITSSGGYTLWKANKGGTVPSFAANTPFHVRLEYRVGKINVYFNNSTTPAATADNASGAGYVSFYTNGSPSKCALLDNVVITSYPDETAQSDVDAVAAGIAAPAVAAGDTALTMPAVPAGYTVSVKSSSVPGVIALDGTITPASADTQVKLVFTVSYPAKNLTADSKELTVTVPELITQAMVDAEAAKITSVAQPSQGQTQLTLPTVPDGYTIRVGTTSDSSAVDLCGSLQPGLAAKTAQLTFTLTHTRAKLSANTGKISVTVPALKSGTVVTRIADDDFSAADLDASSWSMAGTQSSLTGGAFGLQNGTFLRGVQTVGTDYTIEFDLTMKNCSAWVGILFNGAKPQDFTYQWDNGSSLLYIQPNGGFAGIADAGISGTYAGLDPQKPVRVKLEAMNGKLRLYLDGKLMGEGDFTGLDNSYFAFYHNGGTATSLIDNVRVINYNVPVNLQEIADSITSVQPVVYGDKRLTLPTVPASCDIKIHSSSDESVIGQNGMITFPAAAKTVEVVFEITSTKVSGAALTKAISVTVPAAGDSGVSENFLLSKYGLFVHYVPRLTVSVDGTKIMNGTGTELENLDTFAKAFDVRQFAQDVSDMNVQYVILTAWHANMVALYPSQVMKDWGLENHQISNRDLIGEIIDALNAKGVDVYLYTHPRDGHDFSDADAAKVGWTKQPNSANPNFDTFDYAKWNNFINDVYGELLDRYGSKIKGLYLDEGSGAGDSWRVVDYQRLRNTIKGKNSSLVLMQNFYGTNYTNDVGMKEFFYWGEFSQSDGTMWPAFEIPVGVGISRSGWWAGSAKGTEVCSYSAEDMFRYTVLEAAVNTKGGGTAWAAGPYPYGAGWETDIRERLVQVGAYLKPIEESVKKTLPSTAFPTRSGATTGTVQFAATMSADGAYEYIHILNAPASGSTLTIGVPQDGRLFAASALALNDGKQITVQKDGATGALTLVLPDGMTWAYLTAQEKLDYVVRLRFDGAAPAQESKSYLNDTDRGILYGGSGWGYQRWDRYQNYVSGWQTNVGGDYDSDVHTSGSKDAYFEVPFYGTGIAYLPPTGPGYTTSCDIYLDGVLQKSGVSLVSGQYLPMQNVFEKKDLTNGFHTLKVVNTGSGTLVSDAFSIYQPGKTDYLLSGISVDKTPDKTVYKHGQALSLAGGTVALHYNNGVTLTRELTDDMVSGYDSSAFGRQTLTVRVEGKTASFTVSVDPASGTASGGTTGGSTANGSARLYSDVADTDWFRESVYAAAKAGVMNGVGGSRFAPQDNTTRAMIVTMLYRQAGSPDATGKGAWYDDARNWAMKTGVSDGTDMLKNITREQLAAILWRRAGKPAADVSGLNAFADGGKVSAYAREAVAWVIETGVLTRLDFLSQ
jgi:hypothetical protein